MRTDQEPLPERPAGKTSAAPKPSSTAPAPAPMAVDQEAEEPSAKRRKVHDGGPRPQPRRPVAPFQRVGLPSNPRDVRSAPKPQRAWNVVAHKGAKSNGPTKPSYVEAAATLARARPDLKPSAIAKMVNNPPPPDPPYDPLGPIGGGRRPNRRAPPDHTTKGPSRRQILVSFNTPGKPTPLEDWDRVIRGINNALSRANSHIRITAGEIAFRGWSLATTEVATEHDINIVRGWLTQFLHDHRDHLVVSLPQSTSFLQIVDAPRYCNGGNPLGPHDVFAAFAASPLSEHYYPTSNPRIVNEAPTSTSVTVYFNIWDSQSGTRAKALNNRTINLFGRTCTIRTVHTQSGVPFCQRCCQWGHPFKACRGRRRCPLCAGPHSREEHRDHAACCKGRPKQEPHPLPPTPEGEPCPHLGDFACPNCRKVGHTADSNRCEFWCARFNRAKIDELYAKVHGLQARGRCNSNTNRF